MAAYAHDPFQKAHTLCFESHSISDNPGIEVSILDDLDSDENLNP